MLTPENYKAGFLVDEELMGGIAPHPERDGCFIGYVLRHTTGEYLGYQTYVDLEEALGALNSVQRPWKFEKTKEGCGGGKCGTGGGCGQGKCGGGGCGTGACGT